MAYVHSFETIGHELAAAEHSIVRHAGVIIRQERALVAHPVRELEHDALIVHSAFLRREGVGVSDRGSVGIAMLNLIAAGCFFGAAFTAASPVAAAMLATAGGLNVGAAMVNALND